MHPHPLLEKLIPRNTEQAGGRVFSISQHIFTIPNYFGGKKIRDSILPKLFMFFSMAIGA